jgi:hypothetical protein
MPDAAELFNVLRLVPATQPRSIRVVLGDSVKMRPDRAAGIFRVVLWV